MRSFARDVFIPFALIALCIALFFAVFVPPTLRDAGNTSFSSHSDLQSYFLPKYAFGSEELLAGRIPTWNMYEYGGLPFLATAQPAVFYPAKFVLYALFPPTRAHWIFLLSHYALAAFGFVLFARELGLRWEAGVIGALAFLFPVPVMAGNYHPTRIANLAWMPFAFLLTTRILKGEGLVAAACLGMVVALQLNAGYPEFSLDTALFIGVYVLSSFAVRWRDRPRFTALLWVGAGFALGGLISSVQLLPLVEAGVVAKRAAVVSEVVPVAGPKSLTLSGALPYAFYVPGLVAFAVLSAVSRKGWSALVTVLACAWLMNGGGDLLVKLPGFSMIRFPYAFILVSMFFPAWAAAMGCDAFLRANEQSPRSRRLRLATVALGSLVLIGFYLVRLPQFAHRDFIGFQTKTGCVLAALGAASVFASAIALARSKQARTRDFLIAGSVLFVIAQFAAFPFKAAPAPYRRPGAHGEVQRLLGVGKRPHGRAFSLHDVLYGYNLTDRIPSVLGIEESFLPWRLRQVHEKVRWIPFFGYIDMPVLLKMRGFLNAMNLEYLAVKPSEARAAEDAGYLRVASDPEAVLFMNPDRLGPAWVNYNIRRFDDEKAAFAHVTGNDFDPRVEAVVLDGLRGHYAAGTSELATPARAVYRPSPTRFEVEVELAKPGLLVVSEASYPGWQASVDGRSAPWITADYVLRGVELEPGVHRVRFDYQSRALRLGAILSIVGLMFLGAALLVRPIRKRIEKKSTRAVEPSAL